MNFNFLTGNTNPYPSMDPNFDANPFGTNPYFDVNTGQPQNVPIATPSVTPPSGMNMDKLGAGLSALGGALGGSTQPQQMAPMDFAPVPMPQQVALPNLTPQLPSFDFSDYLRKRQAGLL
jgi:hypothetical protein